MSKFTEKFLDIMRLNSDEDDYDYDDDYDDEDDYKSQKIERPRNNRTTTRRRNSDFEELDIPREKEAPAPKPAPSRPASKVVPMRNKRNINGYELCVIKPTTVDDAREITDTLLSNRAVILNMEGLHFELAQRIIDFASGSCYAMNGNLRKISTYIFVITPEAVDISGDFQELLEGNMDVTSI